MLRGVRCEGTARETRAADVPERHPVFRGGARVQRVFILTVLREHKANQVRAAQKLGMHRNTLRRIIRNFELDIRPLRPSTRRPPLSERAVPVQTKARAT